MAGPEPCQRRQSHRFEAPAAGCSTLIPGGFRSISGPGSWYFQECPVCFSKLVSEGAANGSRTSETGHSPVKDFIILTDFSRCQGHMIGRVSRRSKTAPSLRDKDFP